MAARKKSSHRTSPAKQPPGKHRPPSDRAAIADAESDDKVERAIVGKFKLGLRRLCARQVWVGVEQTLQPETHEAIAKELAIARSDVTKGIDYGALSLETLLIILSCLEWEYGDLPPLPPYQERCVAGYAEAVASLVGRSGSRAASPPLTLPAFFSTAALLAHQRFHRLAAQGQLTDAAWERIVAELLPEIARKLGLPPEDAELLPYQSVADFKQLYARWGEPVARCLAAVPNRWAEWLELTA